MQLLLVPTLWQKKCWINQENPCSQGCTGRYLLDEPGRQNMCLTSLGYHLAECRHVPLGQVPFRKNRNLVHLTKWSVGEGTWPGAWESLVQVQPSTWPSAWACPLIQVISQTGNGNIFFWILCFLWRSLYSCNYLVILYIF